MIEPIKLKQNEEINLAKGMHITDLLGLIPTISTAPTWTPRKFSEQFAIYLSGGVYRFYIYNTSDNSWRYTTLT